MLVSSHQESSLTGQEGIHCRAPIFRVIDSSIAPRDACGSAAEGRDIQKTCVDGPKSLVDGEKKGESRDS